MGRTAILRSAICYLLLAALAGCAPRQTPKTPSLNPLEGARQQIRLKGAVPITAGVAKVDITPAVGTPLAGYSKRRGKPSKGIRDPLYARALALSDGEDLVVLVSADLLIFPRPMAERLIADVSRELKIPRQAIILTSTHTHSGAGSIAPGFLYEMVFGHYRSSVEDGIKARVSWAIHQAVEHQQPVHWGASQGWLEGLTENRMNPTGTVDPTLSVFLATTQEEKPLAVLVNFAAHPTLLDSQDFRMSGDYPGELTRLIEMAYPGAVCLFTNGAAGDLRPKDSIGSNPEERVGRVGAALAEAVTHQVNQMPIKSKGDLASWGWRVSLPPPQMRLGWLPIPTEIGKMIRPTSAYLNLTALGDTVFIPLPAELTSQLGWDLRQHLAHKNLKPILLGYANGYLGYAVTPQQYQSGSYEGWMTWYGPTFGTFLVKKIQTLADLYAPEETAAKKQISAARDE